MSAYDAYKFSLNHKVDTTSNIYKNEFSESAFSLIFS